MLNLSHVLPRDLSHIILVYPFLYMWSLHVIMTNGCLSHSYDLLIVQAWVQADPAHVLRHDIVYVLLSSFLLYDFVEYFLKQVLLLLHHSLHLFLRFFLQPESSFLYVFLYFGLEYSLPSLFFFFLNRFFFLDFFLFLFKFFLLVSGISICERLPKLLSLFHKH